MHYRVKITKGHAWYRDKIGEIIEVYGKDNSYLSCKIFYRIEDKDCGTKLFIQSDHCEIIEKVYSEAEKYEMIGRAFETVDKETLPSISKDLFKMLIEKEMRNFKA